MQPSFLYSLIWLDVMGAILSLSRAGCWHLGSAGRSTDSGMLSGVVSLAQVLHSDKNVDVDGACPS